MPEFYLEPLTDRHTCFKCEKTVKKKVLKCNRCHAITYCGVECQIADWDRHGWNCVPAMVTGFPTITFEPPLLVQAQVIESLSNCFCQIPSL